jgi:hypothetical protein
MNPWDRDKCQMDYKKDVEKKWHINFGIIANSSGAKVGWQFASLAALFCSSQNNPWSSADQYQCYCELPCSDKIIIPQGKWDSSVVNKHFLNFWFQLCPTFSSAPTFLGDYQNTLNSFESTEFWQGWNERPWFDIHLWFHSFSATTGLFSVSSASWKESKANRKWEMIPFFVKKRNQRIVSWGSF